MAHPLKAANPIAKRLVLSRTLVYQFRTKVFSAVLPFPPRSLRRDFFCISLRAVKRALGREAVAIGHDGGSLSSLLGSWNQARLRSSQPQRL